MKKILCVDFDGVIHSYSSGWKGADNIPDLPVPGAMEWLIHTSQEPDYEVAIYSARSAQAGGIQAMKAWLAKHGMPGGNIDDLSFPTQKPPAYLTIDDRAICFRGTFPSVLELDSFQSWIKGREL